MIPWPTIKNIHLHAILGWLMNHLARILIKLVSVLMSIDELPWIAIATDLECLGVGALGDRNSDLQQHETMDGGIILKNTVAEIFSQKYNFDNNIMHSKQDSPVSSDINDPEYAPNEENTEEESDSENEVNEPLRNAELLSQDEQEVDDTEDTGQFH